MTSPRRFEGDVPALLADLYLVGTPDYRDDLVQRIERTPQRPAWTFPERWLPVELVTARIPTNRLPVRQLAALAIIAILLAAALVAYVGSHRARVPAPFGVAGNGGITFVAGSSDIVIADPDGGTSVLVSEDRPVRAPSFSLDGAKVAYQRMDADGIKVMVVDLERRRPVQIAVIPVATDLLQWSPDGARLALISDKRVWLANTDGSGAKTLDLGMDADAEIEWRPPDGAQLAVRGVQGAYAGLFLVSPDGAVPQPITPMTTGEFDFAWVTWSPDGARLAYSTADPKEVHILDVASRNDTTVHGDAGLGLMLPRWSPDGTRLSAMTWLSEEPVQVRIGVLRVDGPSAHVTLTGPTFSNGVQHDWSPDGTLIFATGWGTSEPWLLDPDGGPGRHPAWSAAFPDWVEWQRVAP